MRARLLVSFGLVLIGAWASVARAGLSPREEVDLGRRMAREIERTQPLADAATQARVQRVGQAIVAQIKPQVYPYQFRVIASPEINAFALPGGFIYFYEGLLSLTPDDDALAYVIAHEVTHVSHRHISTRLDKLDTVAMLGVLVSLRIGVNVTDLATALAGLSFSRQDENDADATAVEYMWEAGFDPVGAETAAKLMVAMEKTSPNPPRYLRTHPPADHRLGWIQKKRAELAARPKPEATDTAPVPEMDLTALVGTLPPVTLEENPWFPLEVGNEWTYSVQQGTGPKTSYTMKVLGSTPVNGGLTYRAQVTVGGATTSQQVLTTKGEVWKRAQSASASVPWQIEQVTEVAEGQEVAQGGWQFTLVGTEKLTTPCGEFAEARRIRKARPGGEDAVEVWFVQGVGMVKRVSLKANVTELLIRYHLAAPEAPAPAAPAEEGAGQ